jgi:branched-chain amino acid transport system permease protein
VSDSRSFTSLVKNPTVVSVASAVILAVVGIAMAGSLTRGTANQLTSMFLLVTLALAWNLIGGFGGQFSLGQSIFVGIGGYATAVLLTYFDTPLIPTMIVAGLMSSLIGVLLAYPLLRLRGPYLSVGSLGMALAVYGWMINWDFTKASSSYQFPLKAQVDIPTLFVYALVLAVVAFISVVLLVKSPLGLRLVALRDDESGAASLGVRRVRTLIPVWALSGFLTGLMGALLGLQQGTLTVDSAFSISFALDAAIICVLGGLGTLWGPVLGAVVVYYLRFYSADYANAALLIEAAVVVIVVRFFPTGLVGLISRASRWVTSLTAKKSVTR